MSAGEHDLGVLLRDLRPGLHAGRFVFTSVDVVPAGVSPVVLVREDEGTTLVLEVADADRAGVRRAGDVEMAMITLHVHSSLTAVGLTAAVATALTAHGISCNVVAGAHHDHLFVPADRAGDALAALEGLSG